MEAGKFLDRCLRECAHSGSGWTCPASCCTKGHGEPCSACAAAKYATGGTFTCEDFKPK